jgi:3-dehydrosphinganine reductase
MKDFKDKVVYITGGSSGIGLALAKLMAAKGASVIIFARRQQVLDAALKEVSACSAAVGQKHACFSLNVANREQVKSMLAGAVAAYGVPDVLVNCAGRAIPRYFEDISYEQFDETLKVDLYGTWNTTSMLVPLMKERGGYIVNVSSMVGFIGIFGYTDYAAAKFGVLGFSEALRSELKRYNIAVSVLCPPDTDTPGFAEENKTKPVETIAISASASLMKPADVALALLKGMAKREFIIIPNADGRFTYIMKRLLPGLVELVTDAQANKARQSQKSGK